MYTHIRIIRHTLNYLKYMRGETSHKEAPDKITEIDIPTQERLRGTMSRYLQMRLDCMYGNHSLVGSSIQITLSPFKGDTASFSGDDWKNLWKAFLEEMDKIDTVQVRGKGGTVLTRNVTPTNLSNSNQLVCLHMDAKSGIPHIHAAICPVDRNGRTYGLDYLPTRARHAAQEVVRKLGLTDSASPEANDISRAYHTCMDVLLNMNDDWSWTQFTAGLRQHGYRVLEKKDTKGKVCSWSMSRGGKVFPEHDISENLRIGNIYHLWHNLVKPYNNPSDILSLEELIDEVKLRGWYDRFLRGDVQNQMEARLYAMLRHKLIRERELRDIELLTLPEIDLSVYNIDDIDDEEYFDYEEDMDYSNNPYLHGEEISEEGLSQNDPYLFRFDDEELPNATGSVQDSYSSIDQQDDDLTLQRVSFNKTERTEQSVSPSPIKSHVVKKKSQVADAPVRPSEPEPEITSEQSQSEDIIPLKRNKYGFRF